MDKADTRTVLEDWNEIEALFPARRAMNPLVFAAKGMSARASSGRLSAVMRAPAAAILAARLDQMDDARVKALRTLAALNLEQAAYGFRATIVVNVTVPILILTVLTQITSGQWSDALFSTARNGLWSWIGFGVMGFGLAFLLYLVTFALAGLNQARDIRHIIDLQAAERGIYFGLEDIDEMHSA